MLPNGEVIGLKRRGLVDLELLFKVQTANDVLVDFELLARSDLPMKSPIAIADKDAHMTTMKKNSRTAVFS